MSKKVTANKRNRYKIRGLLNQAVLKSLLAHEQKYGLYGLGRQEIVCIAEDAAKAVMHEQKIEVIEKRSK